MSEQEVEKARMPLYGHHEISIDFGFSIDRLRVKESIEYGYIRSQNESNNVHNSMTQLAKDQIILVNKNNNSKHK